MASIILPLCVCVYIYRLCVIIVIVAESTGFYAHSVNFLVEGNITVMNQV